MKANELRLNNIVTVDNPEYHPRLKDVPLRVKGMEELFYQAMNDYIAYTKTLRYRMRMKKRPIKRKEILNRLNNR